MHLFRAKTFLCRPSSQMQTFRYRSIKQNKRFCYRLSKQNKTTLRTMSSNFLQSTDPSTGNVTFSGLEPWVSSFGNPQFLKKPLSFENINSNFWEPVIPCNGILWFPGWECGSGQPLDASRCLCHLVTFSDAPICSWFSYSRQLCNGRKRHAL